MENNHDLKEESPKQPLWKKLFHKPDRIKIEFFPALVNIPLVGLFIGLLLGNISYWEMFNYILSGFFNGYQTNYVLILIILLGIFGVYSIGYILLGFYRLDLAHRPILNIIPLLTLGTMVGVLVGVLGVNERVGLDYVFFSLGPGKSEAVYLTVSIILFVLVGILTLAIGQLSRISPKGTGKYEEKIFHPHFTAITTALSSCLAVPFVAALLFYYAPTQSYWENILSFFQRYMAWDMAAFLLWLFFVIFTICILVIGKLNIISDKLNKILLGIGLGFQILSIIWLGSVLENRFLPVVSGLSLIIMIPQIMILALTALPIWKSVYMQLLANKITSTKKGKAIKTVIISLLILIPYWFVFYQPMIMAAPAVDFPSQTTFKVLNGISVPFQNNTAYPSFETQSSEYRSYINLSGEWKYWKGTGSDPYSLSPRTSYFLDKITQGQHLPNFSDSTWVTVSVPHSITYYEDAEKYWGVVWYRKLITIPENFTGMDMILKFYGVNYVSDVWIDGHYIGYHEGFFTSFAFDVTDFLTPGDHLIAVRVDNPKWGDMFAHRLIPDGCDFFNYGGIEREVWIEAIPNPSIVRINMRQLNYTTSNHLTGTQDIELDIVVKVPNITTTGTLSLGIFPLDFPNENALQSRNTWEYIQYNNNITNILSYSLTLASMNNTKYAAFTIPISLSNVSFWSTKNPNLHAIIANLSVPNQSKIDSFCTQVGFRHISVSGTQLLLNGASLKLAGCSVHEQYPYPIGRSLNDTLHYQDISLLKDLNANWWRGSYSFHPISYIYSDRLGLGCWEEAVVFWVNEINIYQANSRNYYESLWIEILSRDFNRPSILFWGACNEPWAQGGLYKYLDTTKAFLDQHDPSRILSYACVSSHEWSPGFKNLDVCTPNTYAGTFEGVRGDWYNELTRQLYRFGNNSNNIGKPIVSMEFGYWRGEGVNDSEQKRCFEECFKAYNENPNVQGFTWWLAFDYYGADYYNGMGVYNHMRTWHAPVYDSMKSSYGIYTQNNL
jgi:beta-glucuronidase